MKTPISMWQVGVAASLLLLGSLAAAVPRPDISTAGFGDGNSPVNTVLDEVGDQSLIWSSRS